MPKVTIVNDKVELEVPVGANLRQEARAQGVELYQGLDRYFNCRGLGMCGTCNVLVKKGQENVSPPGLLEKLKLATMFSTIGNESEIRLACKMQVHGDCSVEVRPEMNWSGEIFWQKPWPNK